MYRFRQAVTQVGANLFEGTPYDSTLTGEVVYINSILYRCQSDAVTVSIRQGTTVIAEEAFINRVNLAGYRCAGRRKLYWL